MPFKFNTEIDDDQYMGNIWGWKFSLFSLALLIILLIIAFFRYQHIKKTEIAPTIKIESQQ